MCFKIWMSNKNRYTPFLCFLHELIKTSYKMIDKKAWYVISNCHCLVLLIYSDEADHNKCWKVLLIIMDTQNRERWSQRERKSYTPSIGVIGSKPVPAEAKLTPVTSSLSLRFGSKYGGKNSFRPIYEATSTKEIYQFSQMDMSLSIIYY